MIKFSVRCVEKEPIFLEGTEPESFWALPEKDEFAPASPVSYAFRISAAAGSFLVTGSVRGTVSTRCGRCLAPLKLEIRNDHVELCYAKSDIVTEEVDISGDVRDELLIELPMNPLCSEECKGLCPVCGTDLNKKRCRCKRPENPVWSALDDIELGGEK
ncbi:MAG: DUF177 domain-containing protein [Lentisphaeria bacterium]|nr:DUF177 domain-containing protein [Lentisphaeria bacterium]